MCAQNIKIKVKDTERGYEVIVKDGKTKIGYVHVVRTILRVGKLLRPVVSWETHSSLDQAYWNKGIGIAMYAKAIEHGLSRGIKMTSASNSSTMAKRLWRSKRLAEMFNISHIGKRSWVNGVHIDKCNLQEQRV